MEQLNGQNSPEEGGATPTPQQQQHKHKQHLSCEKLARC